jgi:hypothetical protein
LSEFENTLREIHDKIYEVQCSWSGNGVENEKISGNGAIVELEWS